ncbi:pilus assembly FimT family protein [Pantanalinema rosaneae CENA516]|uniref:pilus assembly FimT family protein n=1 Tax=Pantanalinema rosaneae TaxID=1620701 RepID=UPI003D6E6076
MSQLAGAALHRRFKFRSSTSGFTLLEVLVMVAIGGMILAIAAPVSSRMMNTQRLNVAQSELLQAMRQAQSQAKQSRSIWVTSLRNHRGNVQWANHPANELPSEAQWKNLDTAIQIDTETTLSQVNGLYRVQFNHEGRVNGQLGRITFSSKSGGTAKRCLVISTLLGAIRKAGDRPTPVDGRSCY